MHDLSLETLRRGTQPYWSVVAASDNGHGLPGAWVRFFEELHLPLQRVTDYYHCVARLSECAQAVYGDTPKTQTRRRKWFHRLRHLLWDGKVQKVLITLREAAGRLAPEPADLCQLKDQPNAHTLWTNVQYFQTYGSTMDYPAYRAQGWPMGSGAIESACGQMGNRVKHSRMRWTKRTADALHGIKAAIFSGDGRWARLWPPPIPVLEFPAEVA